MKHKVVVPQVGESITSGILAVWYKRAGELVTEGEELFELETDKATLPVPAPVTGVVEILVPTDTEVNVGEVVAEVDDAAVPAVSAPAEAIPAGGQGSPADASNNNAAPHLSPAVRRVVEENALDAGSLPASGPKGNITKGDAAAFAAGRSGGTAPSAATVAAVAPARPVAGSSPAVPQERVKMTTIRRKIAENLVRSKQQSAHLTTFNELDMSAIIALRKRYQDAFVQRHKVRLGYMSFVLKAAQGALQEFRAVNAFIDGTDIVYNNVVNIGVAISTDAGLMVPVVRNVGQKGYAAIEKEIADFTERAKIRRILPDEFAGGTFTISNGGVFGSMLSTPIPNPPQTAVLGMHAIQKRAVVVNDEIVIRPMMYLALTYDHRIIDGRGAIGFLNQIKETVEDPTRLLLDV